MSKALYKFWDEYVAPKYGENTKVFIWIQTALDIPLPKGKNKKVVGLMNN